MYHAQLDRSGVVVLRASLCAQAGEPAHYQEAHSHGPPTEGGDYAAGALSVAAPSLAPFRPLVRCLYTVRPLSLPSAQACATGEKLKCAQPQPQEADPLQVRNPS